MATVKLRSVQLNDREDPSDFLVLPEGAGLELSRTKSLPATYLTTISGRVLRRGSAGRTWPWTITVAFLDRESLAWLDTHLGRTLCVRDPFGQKVFGAIDSLPESAVKHPDRLVATSLTVTEITVSEAV